MIDQWYQQWSGELNRFVQSKGFTPEDAEDITASVFLEAVRFQPADIAPRAWLYRVAQSRIIDAWRKRTRHPLESIDDLDIPVEQETHARYSFPFECLTDEQRLVIEARYVEDLTIEETATRLGLKPGSVKARQARGIIRLRAEMQKRAAWVDMFTLPSIAQHWTEGEHLSSPRKEKKKQEQAKRAPYMEPPPPMDDPLCANGDERLAFLRLNRRALCAECALIWLEA